MKDENEKTRAQLDHDKAEKARYSLEHDYGLTREQITQLASEFSQFIKKKTYDTENKRCLKLVRTLTLMNREFQDHLKAREKLRQEYEKHGITGSTVDPRKVKIRERVNKRLKIEERQQRWASFDTGESFRELFSESNTPLKDIVSRLTWDADTEAQLARRKTLFEGIAVAGPILSKVWNRKRTG